MKTGVSGRGPGPGAYDLREVGGEYTVYRTTHNAIIVLQVLNKSRALSAECLLVRVHSVLSALKCARFAVH